MEARVIPRKQAGMLEVRLLGPPRFTFQSSPWTFAAPPKTLPLLCYLLLNRHASLRRETVAFALWPDDAETDARANLRRHLYCLTQALPARKAERYVMTSGATIRWNPQSGAWSDIDAFERAVVDDECAAEAVDLYGGDLLTGSDEPWLVSERERLQALYVGALVRLTQRAKAEARFQDAAGYAQRLLRTEPWREDALRWLIAARYELGDIAGALADYEAFANRLRDELGAEPANETSSLYELMRRRTALRDQHPPAALRSDPKALPFVGRAAAMDDLSRNWNRAASGTGVTVFIGGAAGVGKSRLISELVTHVESRGGRALAGTTSPIETQPYQAIVETLRRALPTLLAHDIAPLWLGALAAILPDIPVRLPQVKRPTKLEPEAERRRLFDAIAAAVTLLARARPVLLVLEDLHWAGPATIELVEMLARLAASLPIAIVATYRDDELHEDARRAFRRLQEDEVATAEPLGPLERDDVKALAALIFAGLSDVAARAERLYAVSAGNALFLSEAVRAIAETHDGAAMPATLAQTIDERLGRLPEEARALAGTASVLGTGFEVDLLCEMCGWHENEVVDALDVLLEHHVVRASSKRARSAYAFTHDLVRQAMYERTAEPARRLSHRRAARTLAKLYGERDDLAADLAMHFERGDMPADATLHYLRGAERAGALFANGEAIALASRGLALVRDARMRFALLALRADLYARRGDRALVAADVRELATCAEELDDDGARCDVLVREIAAAQLTGDMSRAADAIERLERTASRTGEAQRIATARSCAATHVQLQGRTREAIPALNSALEAYRAVGDAPNEALALGLIAEMYAQSSDMDGADAANREARAIAERGGDRVLLASVLASAARTEQFLHRYDRLKAVALESLAVAREIGDAAAEARALTSYANGCLRRFELEDADRSYAEAAPIHERCGNRVGSATIASNRGVLHASVGDWERAIVLMDGARTTFAELGDTAREFSATFNQAQACLETGDAPRGLELAHRARDIAREHGGEPLQAAAIGLIGICERETGHLAESIEHLESCIERNRKLPNATEQLSFLAELTLAYAAFGDTHAALRMARELDEADDVSHSGLTHPQLVPWAAYRAYALAGKTAEAAASLECARRITQAQVEAMPTAQWRETYRAWRLNRNILAASQALVTV